MTDIVERLRLAAAETDWYLSMQEAADEIERLRNELSDEVMINARLRSEWASPEHVALLEGEIAELRSKLEAAEKDAEIEKLLGYRDALLIDLAASLDREDAFKQTLAAHEAAMLKMRELIKQLIDATPGHAGNCSGLRCREPYCYSCRDETEVDEYLQGVWDLCAEANKSVSIQPTTEFLEAWFKERIGEPVAEVNYRNGCSNTKWLVKMPDGITSLYAVKP